MKTSFNTLKLLGLSGLLALSACGGGGDGAPAVVDNPRGPDPFVFSTAPITSYARIDRMGGPVTATVLLRTGVPGRSDKDDFNQGNPVNDGDFVGREVTQLTKIHYELDDDLKSLGLTLCSKDSTDITKVDVNKCVAQAAPFIVPDVLILKLNSPDGYPNGRDFDDSAVNRLLAVALLDLGVHGLDTVQGALSPAQNDKPFPSTFPYLADPHPFP